jgi:hypothetical protein
MSTNTATGLNDNSLIVVPQGPPVLTKKDKEALVYSNFIYLLPVVVLIYKYFGQKSINISGFVILSVFYIATMLYSMNYHLCQKRRDETADDLISRCYDNGMFYVQAQTNDLTMANYSIFITVLYIMPINDDLRIILQSIGILWIITTQSFNNIFNNILYSSIPTLLVGIFYLIYLIFSFRHHHILSQIISIFGCLFAIAAMVLFIFFRGNYPITHTLWHVFGGIAGGCLMFPAVIGDDKFKWRETFRFTKEEPTLTDTKL